MTWKTKKEFNLENRIEKFQKQFIRTSGNSGSFSSINVGMMFKVLVPWFYRISNNLDLVPVFVTMTFRDIPKGYKGYQLINNNVSSFYRRHLLTFLVDRRRHHLFKDQHPKIIGLPEYGRGELDDWHLHCLMFLKRDARTKALMQESQWRLNSAFRSISNNNVEFYMSKLTDADDFREMTAYMLKKIGGIGKTLKEEGLLFIWA